MAGTQVFKIDGRINEGIVGGQNAGQELFKAFFDFFSQKVATFASWTLYSLNYGNAGTYANPLGGDYHDGANPFGQGAFAVFKSAITATKTCDIYHFIAWGEGNSNADIFPNTPNRLYGSLGASSTTLLSYQTATAVDNVGAQVSPWGGGSLANGSDAKSSPVWVESAGGSLVVLPISNGVGGNYETNKENCIGVSISNTTIVSHYRYHFIGDEDNFVCYIRYDTGNTARLFGQGTYIPIQGTAVVNNVFIYNATTNFANTVDAFGSLTGSVTRDGGVMGPNGSYHPLQFAYLNGFISAHIGNQPNTFIDAGASFTSYSFAVGSYHEGQLGWADPSFWGVCGNRSSLSLRADRSKIVLAEPNATEASAKIEVPWDGVIDPENGLTREGVIS